MKITVTSHVQHDGVDYSEGRHDVSDDVAKSLIATGAAREGWTEDEGALSQAGTQSPPGQSPAGDSGDDGSDGKTPRRSHKS